MNNQESIIKVGSRKSELALIQTHSIIEKLEQVHPDKKFKIGERIQGMQLSSTQNLKARLWPPYQQTV